MIYTIVDSPLWFLRWLEDRNLESPLKDQVSTLKLELRFMRTYFMYVAMAKDILIRPSESFSPLISSAEISIINSTKNLSSAFLKSPDESGPAVCCMLEKALDCKPEIRKAYVLIWDQPWIKSSAPPPIRAVMEFVDSILDNLQDVLSYDERHLNSSLVIGKENIEILAEELKFIGKLIRIIEDRKVLVNHPKLGAFLNYVQVVATRAACFSYFCWFQFHHGTINNYYASSSSTIDMDGYFSDLVEMVKRCTSSDCVDMYFELLEDAKAGAEAFVDILLGDSSDPNMGTIGEELVLLIRLSMELTLSGRCSTKDLTQISADIKFVAKGVGLLRIRRVKDDDQFQQTVSSWLRKMSLIKEKISSIQLINSSEDSAVVVHVKEETVAFHENLPLSEEEEEEEETDPQVTTSPGYSIQAKKLMEDLVTKVNDALFQLLKKMEVIRAEMYRNKQENCRADPLYPLKDQIKGLVAEITSIESESELNCGKLFLAHPEDVTCECEPPSLLTFSFNDDNEIAVGNGNALCISFLQLIDIIKAELFLLEHQDDKAGSMVHMDNRAGDLEENLRFLRIFLMNPPRQNSEERELMLTRSVATAVEAASIGFSLYENPIRENAAMDMNLKILEVLDKIELLKREIRRIYVQVPLSLHSNLPNALMFISSLLGHIEDVLNHKALSIHFVKPQIEMLHAEFESLQSFLMHTANQRDEHEELKDLWTCIADVAYEAEYMIDSTVFGDDPEWYFMLWLPFALEKIKLFKPIIEKVKDNSMFAKGFHNVNNGSDGASFIRDYNQAVGEFAVGLDDMTAFFRNRITRRYTTFKVLPIIGPPGIGKTTLAKNIYNDPRVAPHFPIKVWYSASQEFNRRELFSDILRAIYKNKKLDTTPILYMDIEVLLNKLYRYLKKRRYLIVIDNLCHAEAWKYLSRWLPDNKKGSRVLLTSQHRHVALHASPQSDPYCVRQLSVEESWMLLQKKIFAAGEACPQELWELAGKQILAKCKGIPLVLVLVAGLLARTEKTVDSWQQIAKSCRSESFMELLEDILELCYRKLPDHLKSCFVYFGAFPQGKEISVTKLFRLWTAEGFLQKYCKSTTRMEEEMEDMAEEYLADLIGRNLVIVSQRSSSSDHGIKTCCIHDQVWDFCIRKAKEENLLQLTHDLSNSPAIEKRRLCLSSCTGLAGADQRGKPSISIMSKPSTSSSTACVRSLLCPMSSSSDDIDEDKEYHKFLDLISYRFRLLTVVDLESMNMMGSSFPSELMLLELLRYLAVRGGGVESVPSSLANLWNLETLIVKGIWGEIALPDSFWNMKRLRHVHILPSVTFYLEDNDHELKEEDCSSAADDDDDDDADADADAADDEVKEDRSSDDDDDVQQQPQQQVVVENLLTLSNAVHILEGNSKEENVMRRFPELRKLKCTLIPSSGHDWSWTAKKRFKFPRLDFLSKLESLNMSPKSGRRKYHPFDPFSFPSNLKKLTLSGFRLPWSEMGVIGKLPNLEILKLVNRAFEGKWWDVGEEEGEFRRLRYLKLDSVGLVGWEIDSNHSSFPCLQQLVIHRCWPLRQIPLILGETPTLQRIEMQSCRLSALDSAKQIFEAQKQRGTDIILDTSRGYDELQFSGSAEDNLSSEEDDDDDDDDDYYNFG